MSGQSTDPNKPNYVQPRTGGGDPPVDAPPGKEGHQGAGTNQDAPVPQYVPGTNPPGTNPPIPTPNAANHPVPGSVPGVVPSDDPQNPYPEGITPEGAPTGVRQPGNPDGSQDRQFTPKDGFTPADPANPGPRMGNEPYTGQTSQPSTPARSSGDTDADRKHAEDLANAHAKAEADRRKRDEDKDDDDNKKKK